MNGNRNLITIRSHSAVFIKSCEHIYKTFLNVTGILQMRSGKKPFDLDLRDKRGLLLLELVIAIGIIVLVFVALFVLQSRLFAIKRDSIEKTKATYYAEEAIEALRYIRENHTDKWSAISILDEGTDYWISLDTVNDKWEILESSPGLLESTYERKFQTARVYRDTNSQGEITSVGIDNGDFDDGGSRKITVTVTWDGGASSVTLETVLTDWHALL
jgi:type II secretory pathway pseudopilin PulG